MNGLFVLNELGFKEKKSKLFISDLGNLQDHVSFCKLHFILEQ